MKKLSFLTAGLALLITCSNSSAQTAQVAQLMKDMKDYKGSPLKRYEATGRLGVMGAQAAPAIPLLVASLRSLDPMESHIAGVSLKNLGSSAKSAVPGLLMAVKQDPRPTVRTAALTALVSIDPQGVTPVLIKGLASPDIVMSTSAPMYLSMVGTSAVPSLIDVVKKGNSYEKRSAIIALGFMGKDAKPAESYIEPYVAVADKGLNIVAQDALKRIRDDNRYIPRVFVPKAGKVIGKMPANTKMKIPQIGTAPQIPQMPKGAQLQTAAAHIISEKGKKSE